MLTYVVVMVGDPDPLQGNAGLVEWEMEAGRWGFKTNNTRLANVFWLVDDYQGAPRYRCVEEGDMSVRVMEVIKVADPDFIEALIECASLKVRGFLDLTLVDQWTTKREYKEESLDTVVI